MLVIVLGLAAAAALAVGYVLQQHEAAEVPPGRRMSPVLLLVLARRPVWLGGIGAMVVGQVLGAVALGRGSLVVVEPLLALNVLFALPLGALGSRRHLQRWDWVGAAGLVAGLAVFFGGADPATGADDHHVPALVGALCVAAVAGVVAAVLALARGRRPRTRAALLATAAGTVFGLQDLLTQRTVLRLDRGVGAALVSWQPWALVAAAVVGLTLSQVAFGLADLSASLPATTLAEPVSGIALSTAALGQGLPTGGAGLAFAVAGLALMVTGVVVLTRSPLVVDPHGRSRPPRGRRGT